MANDVNKFSVSYEYFKAIKKSFKYSLLTFMYLN